MIGAHVKAPFPRPSRAPSGDRRKAPFHNQRVHTVKATNLPAAKLKTKPRDSFTRALAIRLKEARENVVPKMTQEAVGKLFKPTISRASVSQWEDAAKGTTPDLDKLITLSRAYHVSLDWLLTGSGGDQQLASVAENHARYNSKAIPPDAIELAKAWASLPDVKKRLYKDAIEWDSAIMEAFPAMKDALVVLKPTYHGMTEKFSKAEVIRQLRLNFEQ